jgi:hypothetical protein
LLIIRRSDCINTASGIVTFCRWPSGVPDGHLERKRVGFLFNDALSCQDYIASVKDGLVWSIVDMLLIGEN